MLDHARHGLLSLALCTLVFVPACDSAPTSTRGGGRAASSERIAVATPPAAEPSYVVDVELPPKPTRGQEAIARVRVHPKAPWHMNLQYPAKLELAASDSVELESERLSKTDAERFDDDGLVFSVLFTPNAKGLHTIDAKVDFAVCGDAACGPVTESVQLAFEVGCREEDTGLC